MIVPPLLAIALRETFEEIGLDPVKARLLGRLDVFEGAIGWEIVPVVAELSAGFEATPAPEEISEVWWEPLADLAAKSSFKAAEDGRATRAHGLAPAAGRPESAWGMTAGILHDLLVRTGHVSRDVLDPPLAFGLRPPLALRLVPTGEADSFAGFDGTTTGIPLPPHPGAFGAVRRHHTHEGVDLYAPAGAEVFAMEDGRVSSIHAFTGSGAEPPTPWWLPTGAVVVEGALGALIYGEIHPEPGLSVGDAVSAGRRLGKVARVLEKDKGRPTSMLHLELHEAGTKAAIDWTHGTARPKTLRDPTAAILRSSAFEAIGGNPPRPPSEKED